MTETIAMMNAVTVNGTAGAALPAAQANCYTDLLARIQGGVARVGIIGLGYVGLPLARAYFRAGFSVLGFDIDPSKVERLHRGESYLSHIDPQST